MVIVEGNGFSGWHALNDTIMGGRSQGTTRVDSKGLSLDAEVVETGGGFVSVRSPLFSPPLDLSAYGGLQLDLVGDGRRYKLAVACADGVAGLTELIPGGLRWVAEFGTEPDGLTRVGVRFSDLTASIRAKPVNALPRACRCILMPRASIACRFCILNLVMMGASIRASDLPPCRSNCGRFTPLSS